MLWMGQQRIMDNMVTAATTINNVIHHGQMAAAPHRTSQHGQDHCGQHFVNLKKCNFSCYLISEKK